MRLIPGKTKVQVELFKGVTLGDILVAAVAMLMAVFVLISSLPGKLYIIIGIAVVAAGLLARLDTLPNYTYLLHILRHFGYSRRFGRLYDDKMLLARQTGEAEDIAFDELFRQRLELQETPKERKKREKAEKKERKREDKLLKSKKASEEEKEAIRERRAAEEERKERQQRAKEEQKPKESKKEKKAREKARKKERKQEDKLLKSKKASEEEKKVIREKRAKEAE